MLLASTDTCPVHAFRLGRNVYATQFHPELDATALCDRIDAYSAHGYYEPHEQESLKAAAREAMVDASPSGCWPAWWSCTPAARVSSAEPSAGEVTMSDHVDVLIIGAGLSGIGAAAQLAAAPGPGRTPCSRRREASGGTWDLFRYPGIRSDSDMYTLGYRFRPWRGDKALADGPSILGYVRETAREYGMDRRIRYGHRVVRADWDQRTARWTVTVEVDGDGAAAHRQLPVGVQRLLRLRRGLHARTSPAGAVRRQVIHPQQWPEDLDYTGKKVVVIGSGATAVTLVPALAERAAHVTMLQRSPTYILSLPGRGPDRAAAATVLPEASLRRRPGGRTSPSPPALFQLSRRRPRTCAASSARGTSSAAPGLRRRHPLQADVRPVGPAAVPGARRRPVPGDPRRSGVGRHRPIRTFTETGLRLESGERLEADVVVTATGLKCGLGGDRRSRRRRRVELPRPWPTGR